MAADVTMQGYGVTNMAGPLKRVAMRRPGALLTADAERWHYAKAIDAVGAARQYDAFVELVVAAGVDVEWMDADEDDLADSVFTYDPSFVVGAGAILLRPGKALRRGEVAVHERFYGRAGIPVLGRVGDDATFEGGDAFWLDASTLAVGRGFRTDDAGIADVRSLLEPSGVQVLVFDLPYFTGPEACLHLMSLVSVLDHDLALVHEPLLPVALHRAMTDRGYQLVAAPPAEFAASSGLNLNVLATGPRQVIAVDGFPGTVAAMRAAGCEVATFAGDELCIPCEGGPTCLTRPLWRSDSSTTVTAP